MSKNTDLLVESMQRTGINLSEADASRVNALATAIFESEDELSDVEPDVDTPLTEDIESDVGDTIVTVNSPDGDDVLPLTEADTGDTANNEELRDKSVSEGTMLITDIFPKCLAVLKKYNPEEAKEYEGIDVNGIPDEEVGDVMDRLFSSMDTIAPEGCYFGSNEGDGADLGFWSAD